MAFLLSDSEILAVGKTKTTIPIADGVHVRRLHVQTPVGDIRFSYPDERESFLTDLATLTGEQYPASAPDSYGAQPLLPLSTLETYPGRETGEALGLVYGHSVIARNMFSDLGSDIKSALGGNLEGIEKAVASARHQAEQMLSDAARAVGANGVVGVRFSVQTVSEKAQLVVLMGTAVTLSAELPAAE
jgi:uncharacterized protein YbjQ (UPF0145 family)